MYLAVFNFIKNIFKDNETSTNVSLVIILLMVIVPIIYFLYTGTKDIIYSAFNIKTKKEVIVEQKNTIDKISDYNKDLNKSLNTQIKISDISINSIYELHKDTIKSDEYTAGIKSNLNEINATTYNNLRKEMRDINIYPPPKKMIVKSYKIIDDDTIVTKNIITVDKENYYISGLNTFNNIEKMYLKVKGDDNVSN